jgi:hypothetical protein
MKHFFMACCCLSSLFLCNMQAYAQVQPYVNDGSWYGYLLPTTLTKDMFVQSDNKVLMAGTTAHLRTGKYLSLSYYLRT